MLHFALYKWITYLTVYHLLVEILISAKDVSEHMKALLHSGVVCIKSIKLNNGKKTTCSTFCGTFFHFHSNSGSDHTSKVQLATKLKNNTLLKKNQTFFLKLNCVYEMNLMFCVAEAHYPWTGRSKLLGFPTSLSLQAPQQLGTAYPVS